MNEQDPKNPKKWTKEELGRFVGGFEILIEMDKKNRILNCIKTSARGASILKKRKVARMTLQVLTSGSLSSRRPAIHQ